VDELASEVGTDPDVLHRLLRALASDGIFAEESPRVFRNTEASELLREDKGWGDYAHLAGGVWLGACGALDASGTVAFPRVHGTDFWSWLATHPDERAAFDRAMQQRAEGRLTRLETIAWQGDETVVDVGGGNGSLLLALLERHPGMRGIVFDLPEVVRDQSSFGGRCTSVAGSFFECVPSGDAYLLATILHDWPDAQAVEILEVIHAASDPGARLVVLEGIIEPGNGPSGTKWLDLLMMALVGGRERDETEWRALLDAAGFDVERVGDGVIEARARP
jgi:O-methyltransferase domain